MDPLLLLGQKQFSKTRKNPLHGLTTSVKTDVETEILLDLQILTFHEEVSVIIFWNNNKCVLNT